MQNWKEEKIAEKNGDVSIFLIRSEKLNNVSPELLSILNCILNFKGMLFTFAYPYSNHVNQNPNHPKLNYYLDEKLFLFLFHRVSSRHSK